MQYVSADTGVRCILALKNENAVLFSVVYRRQLKLTTMGWVESANNRHETD